MKNNEPDGITLFEDPSFIVTPAPEPLKMARGAIVLGPNSELPESQEIMLSGSKEGPVLQFKPDGRILYNGAEISNSQEIVDGFNAVLRHWLKQTATEAAYWENLEATRFEYEATLKHMTEKLNQHLDKGALFEYWAELRDYVAGQAKYHDLRYK